MLWHYTKDGTYSVKSRYWLSNHLPEDQGRVPHPPNGSPLLKAKLWRTTLPPKLKYFYWRVLSLALNTGQNGIDEEYQ